MTYAHERSVTLPSGAVVTIRLSVAVSSLPKKERDLVRALLDKLDEGAAAADAKYFQGPGTSGHPTDCDCAACRNFDD